MASTVLKVLIVDDEPLVGQLVASLVERVGFRAVVVQSAEAALQVAENDEIGMVITDMQMPDLDGVSLCRALAEKHPQLPVIAMSGSGPLAQNEDLRRALKAGARSIVSKPFKLDEFYQAMTIALGEGKIVGQTGR